MSRNFYVNGEASIAVGSGLTELGVSVDGVSISITEFDDGIQVDTFGPRTFGEYQYFLQEVTIKAELVFFDIAAIQNQLTGLPGLSPTFGTFGSAGTLMIQGGGASRLLIRSTPSNSGLTGQATCYNFPFAYLLDAQETKLGTVRSTWTLTWKAIAEYEPSTSQGSILFNNTCS